MDTNIETAKSVLGAMGFDPNRVGAAILALCGQDEVTRHDDPLLTPAQLRARLGISATTLWRLKDLPHIRVGGRKRYAWDEIQDYLGKKRACDS